MTAESMMLQGVPAMSSWREERCWAASAILGVGAAEPISLLPELRDFVRELTETSAS